jgi:hypothetical protein
MQQRFCHDDVDVEKTRIYPDFEPLRSIGFNDHDPAKVPKFKYRHDGALSIRNFALNQAQLKKFSYLSTCQPPTKKELPTSMVHGISYLFYLM